jgi:hypothetical protein
MSQNCCRATVPHIMGIVRSQEGATAKAWTLALPGVDAAADDGLGGARVVRAMTDRWPIDG